MVMDTEDKKPIAKHPVQSLKSKWIRLLFNATLTHTITKNETIFDEIIYSDYVDHGQTAYMGSPGRGIDGAKNDLRFSLDKLDDLNYVE